LADRAKTHYVPEYGRTLWEAKGGALAYEDVLKIAKTQLEHEAIKTAYADTYLFCDTSPLTTLFYSEALFGKVDPLLEELSHTSYDYVFLCDDDFDFVQDGTRQDEAFREKQQGWYKKTLKAQGINYILLSGPIDARIAKALSVIRA
jgi:nicotinamide riboside kinase